MRITLYFILLAIHSNWLLRYSQSFTVKDAEFQYATDDLLLGLLLMNQNNANAANGGTANNSVLGTTQVAIALAS